MALLLSIGIYFSSNCDVDIFNGRKKHATLFPPQNEALFGQFLSKAAVTDWWLRLGSSAPSPMWSASSVFHCGRSQLNGIGGVWSFKGLMCFPSDFFSRLLSGVSDVSRKAKTCSPPHSPKPPLQPQWNRKQSRSWRHRKQLKSLHLIVPWPLLAPTLQVGQKKSTGFKLSHNEFSLKSLTTYLKTEKHSKVFKFILDLWEN